MEKLYSSKTCLKEAGGGMHPSLDPPLPALITMTFTTAPTNRFGFSMMWGKFCLICFEIVAGTALAHLDTSKRGGAIDSPTPLWVRH